MNEAHDTGNHLRPGLLLGRGTLLAMALMLALSMAASPALGQSGWSESTTAGGSGADSEKESKGESGYTEDELRMVEEINTYRDEQGLSPLEVSDEASEAASGHSSDMATYDFFGHETEESDTYEPGADFSVRMDEAGYDYNTDRSENLAAGNSDVEPTLEQWETSPGHNQNMLREDMRVVGIGKSCSRDSAHGCYWTTTFGGHAPDDARPATEIEPSQNEQDTGSTETGSADNAAANGSGEDSSSTTDVEQAADEGSSSGEDSSVEDSSGSNQDGAEPRVEMVEQQSSGEESSPDSGWSGESSGDGGSSNAGSSGDSSGESQQAVQITQNGETKTLTGDEANEEICKQFGETRKEVISQLREDTGSSGAISEGSTSEGSSSEDPAAAIKNDIADDFEESLLNPESCQGGEQSLDTAEGTTGESGSGDDASSDDAASDQYASSEDASGEDGQGGGSSGDDSSGQSVLSGSRSAGSQYDDEGAPSGAERGMEGSPESGEPHDATATVERAKDGDTLALKEPVEGHDTVRLIGVDTPELNAYEDGEPEPYAEEASEFTASELEGEEVSLEFGQERTDDYDRLLAYVYTDNEEDSESSTTSEDKHEMFNETLLEEGYGEVLTIEPNSRYEDRFEEAESQARDEGKGIWSEGDSSGSSSGADGGSSENSADGASGGSTSSGESPSGESTSGIATPEGEDSPNQGKGATDSGGDENTLTGLVIFWD